MEEIRGEWCRKKAHRINKLLHSSIPTRAAVTSTHWINEAILQTSLLETIFNFFPLAN